MKTVSEPGPIDMIGTSNVLMWTYKSDRPPGDNGYFHPSQREHPKHYFTSNTPQTTFDYDMRSSFWWCVPAWSFGDKSLLGDVNWVLWDLPNDFCHRHECARWKISVKSSEMNKFLTNFPFECWLANHYNHCPYRPDGRDRRIRLANLIIEGCRNTATSGCNDLVRPCWHTFRNVAAAHLRSLVENWLFPTSKQH